MFKIWTIFTLSEIERVKMESNLWRNVIWKYHYGYGLHILQRVQNYAARLILWLGSQEDNWDQVENVCLLFKKLGLMRYDSGFWIRDKHSIRFNVFCMLQQRYGIMYMMIVWPRRITLLLALRIDWKFIFKNNRFI